jgi:hypothetical protein
MSCASNQSENHSAVIDEKLKIIEELKDSISELNSHLSEVKFTPYTKPCLDTVKMGSEIIIPVGLYKRNYQNEVKVKFCIDDSLMTDDSTRLFWHPKTSASNLFLDKDWFPTAFTLGQHKIYGETHWKINGESTIENWESEYIIIK